MPVSALTWGRHAGLSAGRWRRLRRCCWRRDTAWRGRADLLGFRARAAGERLAWGVALSFGAMTIVSVLLGKYGSLSTRCAGWRGICALGPVWGLWRA